MKRVLCAVAFLLSTSIHAQTWSCGVGRGALGGGSLTGASWYRAEAGGWDLGLAPEEVDKAGCTSAKPFFFSAPVAEGNYRVTVVLGGGRGAQSTVKAEARRLMLLGLNTNARQYRTESFIVNVRRPEIAGGGEVKRKPREIGSLDWDEKLTLEFDGDHPAVRSIRIEPVPGGLPTVFLAGDSIVVDQDKEPWAAWGQMLPAFFGAGVAIANHAESGETIRSFIAEQRFAKIFSVLQTGDLLFLQFAHNDQKTGAGFVPPQMYADLLRRYIAMARERGATPVLVTGMNRRTFDATGHITNSSAPYSQTMREVAAEQKVELIDLHQMSQTLYEAVGEPDSRSLFVYAAANTYPGQTEALHDDTHFNNYGAWELARCVVVGLQRDNSPLVRFLRDPSKRFDPRQPDSPATVAVPETPFVDTSKPYGR